MVDEGSVSSDISTTNILSELLDLTVSDKVTTNTVRNTTIKQAISSIASSITNTTTSKQLASLNPSKVSKYEIWGLIRCYDEFECLEYLYYAVLSLIIVFIVLLILIITLFIIINYIKKKDSTSTIKKVKSKRKTLSHHVNKSYESDTETESESTSQYSSEEMSTEDIKIKTKKINEAQNTKENWEMHKKRSKMYQESNKSKKYDASSDSKPRYKNSFSYCDPNEYKEKCLNRNNNMNTLPRLQVYTPASNDLNSTKDKNVFKISQSKNGSLAKQYAKSNRNANFNEEDTLSSDSNEKKNRRTNKNSKKHISRSRSRSNSSRKGKNPEVYRL